MAEQVRSVRFSIMIDTNKQSIGEVFHDADEFVERLKELDEAGLIDLGTLRKRRGAHSA